MINYPTSTTNIRFLLPETLWLEPEHFEQAKETSERLNDEKQQWQAYLNALAMLTFEAWLKERFPNHPIQQVSNESVNEIADVSYLNVGKFKLGLIATEHVLDEIVRIPKLAVQQPELAAHFYVVLEVLEEHEQVIVRGFLRYDEFTTQTNGIISAQLNEFCLLPLSALDPEINHLVVSLQYLQPSAIALPAVAVQSVEVPAQQNSSEIRTRLSQWLQGILDEGWQTIDTLINPDTNLAWSTRSTLLGTKGGKLINFGVQLGHQTIALLVTVTPENEGKIGINIQVLPGGGVQVLPPQLKLTLFSREGTILQEVQSREQDNYIQLKPFRGKPGVPFNIEVSLQNIRVREAFEL